MKYCSCSELIAFLLFCNYLKQGFSYRAGNDRPSTNKFLIRQKRKLPLLFHGFGVSQFVCGFGIPVETDNYESITTGVVFKSQLSLPSKASDLTTHITHNINNGRGFRYEKDIYRYIRWEFYNALELWANSIGLNGQVCVLKTLCEVAQIPFDNNIGDLWNELAHIIFTPSLSTDDLSHPLSGKYVAAAKAGLKHDCSVLFKECQKSLLNIFTYTV